MLEYSEIREKKIIIYENEPCEVTDSHVARTQQRKPQNQVKLRSLMSGRTFTTVFHASDTAEEADISKKEVKFLYHNKGEYWFADPQDPKNRFKFDEKLLGDQTIKFLKDNLIVSAVIWEDEDGEEKTIQVKLPIKVEYTIKECPPNIKGNSATNSNKQLTLENGTVINGPMFLNEGDKIIVNTETGEYVERV